MLRNRAATLLVIFVMGSLILAACAPARAAQAVSPADSQTQEPTQPVVKPAAEVAPTPAGQVNLTELDAGKTIHLLKGETLIVALEGNPSTGYNWEMESAAGSILAQVGEPESVASSNLMGAPAMIKITFKAEQDGEQTLKLVYHRVWEKNVPPEKTFEVTVVVGQGSPTAAPQAVQNATPATVVYPANGMKGWLTYTNEKYGFNFQYPPDWTLEKGKGTMASYAVLLHPGAMDNVQMQVAFKKASDDAQIGRTGVGSGELVTLGKVTFIEKEINREVLVFDGKHMTVMYICQGCMQRGDLVFGFDLDYLGNWTDQAGLPESVQTQADLVVASVKLSQ